MKVFIGTDHSGLDLKNNLKAFLEKEGYEVEDCGAYEYDKDDDYPDSSSKTAEKVSKDPENSRGIVIGGSGQGEAMTANKYKGVRCAIFYTPAVPVSAADISGRKSTDPFEIIKLTREHNNSNMLSISARFLTEEQAKTAVKLFLESSFPGDPRHARRVEKIKKIEQHD
jgi:ribose 5-phosphate isomerase B